VLLDWTIRLLKSRLADRDIERLKKIRARFTLRSAPAKSPKKPSKNDVDTPHKQSLKHLFDAGYVATRYLGAASSLADYLAAGADAAFDPNPLFSNAFYRGQLSEPLPAQMTPLEHYVLEGAAARLNPSPLFDTGYYLDTYPDVAAAGVNPLLHFLRWGALEGRVPLSLEKADLSQVTKLAADLLEKDPNNPFGFLYLAGSNAEDSRVAQIVEASVSLSDTKIYALIGKMHNYL
jgi:hypothetical protein